MNEPSHPEARRPFPRTLVAIAAIAVVGVGAGVGSYAIADSSHASSPSADTIVAGANVQPVSIKSAASSTLIGLYKRTSPGVVDITVTTSATSSQDQSQTSPWDQPQSGSAKAEGSGFVLDTKGDIVTNNHVVTGGTSFVVKFQNGKTAKATLVGTDPDTDLAVIKVDPSVTTLTPLTFGDSTAVQTGQGVFAIGSPFGLTESLSAGIVSATGRQIESPNNHTITNAIQTDAAINHGNSGGPLLDASGKVVGVNSQIESDSGGNDGVGFAIPSNTVKTVTDQLITGQKVAHPLLGVQISDAPNGAGAAIEKITTGSAADTAGLKAGDVITSVDSTPVTSASDLENIISADTVGQQVNVTITRSDATQTVQVTLGSSSS
jgi:putative serine protease PepD